METPLRRWLNKLPPPLQPRGIRYHGTSTTQSAVLKSNRVFVLPTRQGLFFLTVLLVMLVGATNYSNNMAFALAFLLGSALFVSILHTYHNLVGLKLTLSRVDDCFAGNHAGFLLTLANPNHRQRFDIKLINDQGVKTHLTIAGHERGQARLAIPAPRRGRLPLGRITVFTTYPFGLVLSWAYVDVEGEALVYPRPSRVVAPATRSPAAGEGQEIPEPGSDDFHGFHQYQPGDSLRHINWKALAREQGLVTKQFHRHTTPELWFDWSTVTGSNTEERLSRLCRMVLDAENRQQHYGLRMPSTEIPLGNGAQHQRRCLQQLAVFGLKG